jgi:hypothetical protein
LAGDALALEPGPDQDIDVLGVDDVCGHGFPFG